jgi:hypothetical protein
MVVDKADIAAKLQSIQNVSGVRAVAPGVEVAAKDRQAAASVAAQKGLDPDEAAAFEKAGWTFVKPRLTHEAEGDHDVIVDVDGHLKVVGHALNVKFDPALTREAAERILGCFGLGIRRALGFAPNLFLVTGNESDFVSKAKSLNQLDGVVYAEPVFIEPIEGR